MRAKKSLGQNFLVDPNLQRKIVGALEPAQTDTVIEIGPGQGALTQHLVDRVGRLVAVELDDQLADRLGQEYQDEDRVRIIHADALEWDPHAVLERSGVKVVGNIPYNITSPLIFRLLEWRPAPERIILMIQKEVADRLAAAPGRSSYGALTVGVRAVATVERLFDVGRRAFRPVPNVDSAVVAIRPMERDDAGLGEPLRALTRAAFSMRRKQFQKILRTAPGYGLDSAAAEAVLSEVGLDPRDRPEVADPPTFIALAAALRQRGYPSTGADG